MEREKIIQTELEIQKIINLYLSSEFDPFGKDEGIEEADAALDDRHDDYQTEQLGRLFAKCGDDFDKGLTDGLSVANQTLSTFQNISATGEDKAWEKFNDIMVKAIESNGIKDPFKIVGSCLLSIRGLKHLGSSVKLTAQKFTMRFIVQRNLSQDIVRLGGLKVLEQEID